MSAQAAEREVYGNVYNPADVENKIEETKNRIAAGVKIVTSAEKEAKARRRDFDLAYAYAMKETSGPEYLRKAEATITAMPHRAKAEDAELAFRYAERNAHALDKELFAWQSILNSVRSMYNAAGVR